MEGYALLETYLRLLCQIFAHIAQKCLCTLSLTLEYRLRGVCMFMAANSVDIDIDSAQVLCYMFIFEDKS